LRLRDFAVKTEKELLIHPPGDGGWTVDVSALSPGIYMAVVRDNNHFIGSAKFVVVR